MKRLYFFFRRFLLLFFGGVWACSLLWSTTAAGKAPWFDKKDCKYRQKITAQSRTDRFSYDASGKISENLWDTGLATCALWINVCGDTIFKSKMINTKAGESCPANLNWKSVALVTVCCDNWKRAKQSNSPCNPLTDADCDGVDNQEDDSPTEAGPGEEEVKPEKKGGATPRADLSVAIQAPHRFPLGITPFAVVVHNHGPSPASAVRLTASVGQAKVNYATTSQGNCTVNDSSLNCEFDTIHSDEGRSVSVQIRTEQEGELRISADVSGGASDSNTVKNHAEETITVKQAIKGTFVPSNP